MRPVNGDRRKTSLILLLHISNLRQPLPVKPEPPGRMRSPQLVRCLPAVVADEFIHLPSVESKSPLMPVSISGAALLARSQVVLRVVRQLGRGEREREKVLSLLSHWADVDGSTSGERIPR